MTTNKPEVVAYRYTASRSFGKRNRKWHYQESFPHASNREVAEIGQLEELIRLSDYESLQAECEKLRKDAERYRFARAYENDCFMLNTLQVASMEDLDAAIDAAMEQTK